MLRYSANISMGFKEYPSFYERFQKAADLGFKAVESLSPLGMDVDKVVEAVEAAGVRLIQFNFLDGDLPAGQRGHASHPAMVDQWRAEFAQALALAPRVGARQINSLAGIELDDLKREEQIACLVDNLKWAAPQLEAAGLLMMLEALNAFDNPGYLLTTTAEVLDVLEQVGSDAIMCQYDVYHMQRMEGDLVKTIRDNIAKIGHIQVADNPGRHQPGTGEINYGFVLQAIEDAGYDGYIGLEYAPDPDTAGSLGWLPEGKRVESTAADLNL